MSRRVTILYIAGAGRSATTILGHLLGQAPGFCFVGEAMYGWRSLHVRRCGCGVALPDCAFWKAVHREAGGTVELTAPEFFGLGQVARWRHLSLTLLPGRRRWSERLYGERWRRCERLYAAVAAVSGAEVIVDCSKALPYAYMLSLMPSLDLRVVHLVRDARAVAYSWKRLKPAPDRVAGEYMGQRGRAKAAVLWAVSNLGTELFFGNAGPERYLRLRYEDLVAAPRESLDRILRMATARPAAIPFADEHTVVVEPTHSIAGNPDRMRSGPVELRYDGEWMTRQSRSDRRVVTALTWPLLARYGYLGGRPRGGAAFPGVAPRP